MLTHHKRAPAPEGAIGAMQDLVHETARRVRSVDLTTLRQIRLHPRAAAAIALLTGLTSGVVVGAIVQQRLQAR